MAIPFRSPAATLGSSKHSDPKAAVMPLSESAPPNNTHVTSHHHHDSDLSHAGTWITDDQQRRIASVAKGPLTPELFTPKR
jgi:hypothetical protein